MSEDSRGPGELIYEYSVEFTQITDYGVALDTILSGAVARPAEGARFDVAFEGTAVGPKLRGTVRGVDYLQVRADGRIQLHLHAEITTQDGKSISLTADGVALIPAGSPVGELRENVTLTTSHPEYAWVNPIQVWATGTLDLTQGSANLKGYAA